MFALWWGKGASFRLKIYKLKIFTVEFMKPGSVKFFQKHLLPTANFVSQGFISGRAKPSLALEEVKLISRKKREIRVLGTDNKRGKINPLGRVWERRVLGAVEAPGKWAYVMGVTYEES